MEFRRDVIELRLDRDKAPSRCVQRVEDFSLLQFDTGDATFKFKRLGNRNRNGPLAG